jgi:serine/threonine protein kinase
MYQIETGKYYAVKIINKRLMEGREHMIRNEINVLRKISQNHKNILSLVDYFETLNNCKLMFVFIHAWVDPPLLTLHEFLDMIPKPV